MSVERVQGNGIMLRKIQLSGFEVVWYERILKEKSSFEQLNRNEYNQ